MSSETRSEIAAHIKTFVYSNRKADNGFSDKFESIITRFPFGILKACNRDILAIRNAFETSIYGMKRAKEAIVNYLVLSHYASQRLFVQPLLLIGPPGVGKTCFSRILSEVLELPLIRISFSTAYDRSVLKGSDQHWNNSRPGLLLNEILRVGCINPVVLLDEIDKAGSSSVGKVIDALAELLDPEQSHHFKDDYCHFGIDLGQALFICTANDITSIPSYIVDRCEVIHIDEYSQQERSEIITNYLCHAVMKELGIHADISISPHATQKLSENTSLRVIKQEIRNAVAQELSRQYPHPINQIEIDNLGNREHLSKGKAPIGFRREN